MREAWASLRERQATQTYRYACAGWQRSNTDSIDKEEVDDLAVILQHVQEHYSQPLLAFIGHSKGAVVLLTLASQQSIPCKLVGFRWVFLLPLSRTLQLINVSGRFESSNVPASQRFTAAQNEELRNKGSFVWLNYRAGAEPERPLRRPYVVTQEELDAHANRRMDCLDQLPGRCMVLNLHGKGDGTGY